jgi:nucleotide-binding universal stress UspA family protein
MKLLIGCGPTTNVHAIEDDLHRAGLSGTVEAVVLSVADLLPIPPGEETATVPAAVRRAREHTARALENARQVAERAAATLRKSFPSWTIAANAEVDSPAWAIVRNAEEWRPGLIVLSSDDRSVVERVVLGSVSHTVLVHAPTSVRVVRERHGASDAPLRVLIGYDCSSGADAAVAAVAARTWPPRTELRVVTAFDATLANMLGVTGDTNDERDAAAHGVKRAVARLSAAGVDVATTIVDGDPRQLLVEQAEQYNADCVFVGARGLRGSARILLGSVSSAVAARASCTVEVVRR